MLLLAFLATAVVAGRPNFLKTEASLKNCTRSQIYEIQMDMASLEACNEKFECGAAQADNNERRRLQDDEQSSYDTFSCYCNKCSKYLVTLQTACTACDAPNYDDPCGEDAEEGQCEEGGEAFDYSQNCLVGGYLLAAHQDTFCQMMSDSKTCLQEMEYMVNPPPEEEEEDDDNNNRRRLQDEENQVAAEDVIACWASPFTGGENYNSLTGCSNLCTQFGNTTYDYIYDGQEEPVQQCGISVSELDLNSETTSLLPEPVQHQGVACVTASCTAEDAESIMTYVGLMSGYSDFINFNGGEDDNNNNNNDDENANNNVKSVGVPASQVQWKCSGSAGEGAVATDDFPADDESDCDEGDDSEKGDGNNASADTTASIFAIVFALGMGVFACLFLHYYRQLMKLKKSNSDRQGLVGAAAQANDGNYQGVGVTA